jgi:hypothetical protein
MPGEHGGVAHNAIGRNPPLPILALTEEKATLRITSWRTTGGRFTLRAIHGQRASAPTVVVIEDTTLRPTHVRVAAARGFRRGPAWLRRARRGRGCAGLQGHFPHAAKRRSPAGRAAGRAAVDGIRQGGTVEPSCDDPDFRACLPPVV